MQGDFEVRYADAARDDLIRLFNFLLERAKTGEDLEAAQSAINNLTVFVEGHLSRSPFIYRKLGQSPFLRELIVPFRGAGYVVLYEIDAGSKVTVVAVRHQLEDDYH